MPQSDNDITADPVLYERYVQYLNSLPSLPKQPTVRTAENVSIFPATFHIYKDEIRANSEYKKLFEDLGPRFDFAHIYDAGVYAEDGTCLLETIDYSRMRRALPAPARQIDESASEFIPGRWLYCGAYHPHSGHFLAECIGRLWGIAGREASLDGLLWVNQKPPGSATRSLLPPVEAEQFQGKLLKSLGINHRTMIVQKQVRIEQLVIPDQLMAFDLGLMLGGHEVFRRFTRERLRPAEATPDPDCRLFVSRAGLGQHLEFFLFEQRMEDVLRSEGWHVIRPETMSLDEQFDAYTRASTLLFSEGSALHFYALVSRPDQRVRILRRRFRQTGYFANQIRNTGVKDVDSWMHLRALLKPQYGQAGPRPGSKERMAERAILDLEALRGRLVEAGLVSPTCPPFASEEEVSAEIERVSAAWAKTGATVQLVSAPA